MDCFSFVSFVFLRCFYQTVKCMKILGWLDLILKTKLWPVSSCSVAFW